MQSLFKLLWCVKSTSLLIIQRGPKIKEKNIKLLKGLRTISFPLGAFCKHIILTPLQHASGPCLCQPSESVIHKVFIFPGTCADRRDAYLSPPINSLLKNSRTRKFSRLRQAGVLVPALLFMHDLILLGHKTDPARFSLCAVGMNFAWGTESSRPKSYYVKWDGMRARASRQQPQEIALERLCVFHERISTLSDGLLVKAYAEDVEMSHAKEN